MYYTLKPIPRLTLAAAALALAAAALVPAPAFAKTKHTRKMHTKMHAKKHMTMHRAMRSPMSSARPVAPTPTPGHVLPGVRNSVGDAGGSATPASPSSVNSQRGR